MFHMYKPRKLRKILLFSPPPSPSPLPHHRGEKDRGENGGVSLQCSGHWKTPCLVLLQPVPMYMYSIESKKTRQGNGYPSSEYIVIGTEKKRVEEKEVQCICPLCCSVHHNFARDGR